MNSWIATMYSYATYKLICSTCHNFTFLFRLPWTLLFMSNSVGVFRTAEDTNPTGAPGPCSQFLVQSELVAHLLLLLCMYYFSYFMFYVVYVCCSCLVVVPGLHSFDFHKNLGSLDYSFDRQYEYRMTLNMVFQLLIIFYH